MTWHAAAKVADVRAGEILACEVAAEDVALYLIDGRIYATSNTCTHAYALLSDGYLDGECIECPIHQATFHVPTGEVRSPPATEPLKTYPTKIEGETIFVELPD
jgi:nitrite reductase/ring-hydroxylating ferredoxin subunit